MRGIIRSEKTIKTENAGEVVIIKTSADSSLKLENFKDEKIIDVNIEDGADFEIKICFWQIQEPNHVSKKMYTLKKDYAGVISLFDGCENLLEPKGISKEKIKEVKEDKKTKKKILTHDEIVAIVDYMNPYTDLITDYI